jgi:protein SCO1
VGVTERLQSQVPVDAMFQDENGKPVHIGDYFDGKRPTLLVLAYHSCKTLCSFVQSATLDAMKQISWTAGKQYQVITLSISPHDTVGVASDKRAAMLASYNRAPAEQGWHFLVGNEENIKKVADAVGWGFKIDSQGEYAHPTAITLLTPEGKVARYLYGIEFDPNDLKLGLLEASEGKSIGTVDRIILYCYHYDPQDRKYSLIATRVMRIAGGVTVVVFGGFLGIVWMRERRKKPKNGGKGPSGPTAIAALQV